MNSQSKAEAYIFVSMKRDEFAKYEIKSIGVE